MSGPINEIRQTLEVLFESRDMIELRAFDEAGRIRSGYFDNREALAEAAVELDRLGWQVYVTLNPVDAALLARAANRVVDRPRATTSDNDVVRRRWMLLDLDAARPSGVSSSNEEKWAAYLRAREARDWLREKGWPEPVIADSGNGFHLLYRVDLPSDRESQALVKGALEALSFRFDDDEVTIDTGVHNAARITRLYGTKTRKGDDTPERPHRRSAIIKIPEKEAQ